MVFFVCEVCNETLKRAKVEAHLSRCWTQGVTCVDCNVTFDRKSYHAHSTCISESEKYEGIFKKTPKKESAQDLWNETMASAATGAPATMAAHLARIASYGNVPRNEKKFKNFVKNSLNLRSDAVVSALWDYLVSQRKSPEAEKTKRQREDDDAEPAENAENEALPKKKKKKTEALPEEQKKTADLETDQQVVPEKKKKTKKKKDVPAVEKKKKKEKTPDADEPAEKKKKKKKKKAAVDKEE